MLCYLWPVLLAVSAVSQSAAPPRTSETFRISGVVVNAVSGEPLARAEVRIGRSQEQEHLRSMITGRDGRFIFEGLARGKYWLSATRRGFPRQAFEQHGDFFTAIVV